MKWSEQTWITCEPVYDRILELPFLKELMNGKLQSGKFYHYIQQDAIYLAEFGKVMAGIASKLNHAKHRDTFLLFAKDSIAVELSLHENFLKDAPPSSFTKASPACLLYTGYLASLLHFSPVELVLAGILPCFWIYQKVGEYILEHQHKPNPYQQWIDTYAGEEFAGMVILAIDICDEFAEMSPFKSEMTETFLQASKMEWIFWNSAYHMETWPI